MEKNRKIISNVFYEDITYTFSSGVNELILSPTPQVPPYKLLSDVSKFEFSIYNIHV